MQEASPLLVTARPRYDGVNIFYREAGPRDVAIVLLLCSSPTSWPYFAT
jgi:hypothetical protein